MSNENDPLARLELDDVINEGLDEELEEGTEESSDTETETPPQVEKAKKHGYLTEEQYKAKYGSLDGFKSPDKFNKYGEDWGEVSDVIKGLQKQVEESRKQTEALVSYQKRTEDRAYQRARQELETQLQEARDLGDVHGVEQLTREKAKIEFQESHQQHQQSEEERQSVEKNFQESNKHWFGINHEMTQRAIQIDQQIRQEAKENNVPLTYTSLAKQVTAHLKAEFPEVMIVGNKSGPNISASSSNANKGASGNSVQDSIEKVFNSLDEEQKLVYAAVKRGYEKGTGKQYTKTDFIKQLKKDGEI